MLFNINDILKVSVFGQEQKKLRKMKMYYVGIVIDFSLIQIPITVCATNIYIKNKEITMNKCE